MALPNVGSNPRHVENLSVGGGYGSLPDGGAEVDQAGNVAADGDMTVDGSLTVGGEFSTGGDLSVADFLNLGAQEALTIASGAVSPTKSYTTIATEAAASTDDLETINGGVTGDILILTATAAAETITVKNGTGNIVLVSDFVMAGTWDTLALIKRGSNWIELFRMDR